MNGKEHRYEVYVHEYENHHTDTVGETSSYKTAMRIYKEAVKEFGDEEEVTEIGIFDKVAEEKLDHINY